MKCCLGTRRFRPLVICLIFVSHPDFSLHLSTAKQQQQQQHSRSYKLANQSPACSDESAPPHSRGTHSIFKHKCHLYRRRQQVAKVNPDRVTHLCVMCRVPADQVPPVLAAPARGQGVRAHAGEVSLGGMQPGVCDATVHPDTHAGAV